MLGVIALIVLIAGIAIALYLGHKFYPTYQEMSIEADKIIEQIDERTFVRLDPTVIVRKDGSFVREFKPAPYKYIEINDMPKKVKKAFIAIEDKNFYKHRGFDIKANLRAVKALIDNRGKITQGGSTITQQLVKNTFLTHEQTYKRKVKEILIAVRLENKLSKDKIIEAKSLLSNVKVDDYKNKYEAEINEGYDVIEGRWNKIIEELNEPEVQPANWTTDVIRWNKEVE